MAKYRKNNTGKIVVSGILATVLGAGIALGVVYREDIKKWGDETFQKVEDTFKPDDSTSETPDDSGSTETPDDSGSTETPDDSGSTETPDDSGSTETPDDSGSTETPDDSGSTETPEDSDFSELPAYNSSMLCPVNEISYDGGNFVETNVGSIVEISNSAAVFDCVFNIVDGEWFEAEIICLCNSDISVTYEIFSDTAGEESFSTGECSFANDGTGSWQVFTIPGLCQPHHNNFLMRLTIEGDVLVLGFDFLPCM